MKAKPIPHKLAAARLRACKRYWPHCSHAILSPTLIEEPRVLMAVDQHWRLYYNKAFVEDTPLDELTGTVMHEVGHLLLKHHKRRERYVSEGDVAGMRRWNLAADITVNGLVVASGASLPDGAVTAKMFGFDEGLTTEAYYMLLRDRDAQREQEENDDEREQSERGEADPEASGDSGDGDDDKDGDPGDDDQSDGAGQPGDSGRDKEGPRQPGEAPGQCEPAEEGGEAGGEGGPAEPTGDHDPQCGGAPGGQPGEEGKPGEQAGGDPADQPPGESGQSGEAKPAVGGSCSDGIPRDWELPPPSDDTDAPGLQEWEQDVICRNVAERAAKSMGNGAGGWQGMIDEILEPKLDPRRLLMKAMNTATANLTSGNGRFSYRRPSRRPSIGGTVRPRAFQPVPRITVIIDTSGSMGKDEMSLGVGLVAKCLNGLRLRDGIEVVTGDVGSAWAEKVCDPSKIRLCGGGGTDMGAIICECAELPAANRPELIVVVTDGMTPWPEQNVGIPTIACITGPSRFAEGTPSWIETINLVD